MSGSYLIEALRLRQQPGQAYAKCWSCAYVTRRQLGHLSPKAKVAAKVPKPAAKIARGTIERVGDIAGIGMDLAAKGGQTSGTTQGLPGASGSNPWGGSVTRDCGQCSCELVWEKKIAGREFDNCITEATLKCTCNYDRCKTAHAAHCIANLAS
ncbi:uncharacterized protein LOC142579785 isoform X2 [Dermacentor variabilis]|uniref:uncharacterized protein LOC142579785 isoform X2 n=1 Tax=Dermacentor variabilis TaxID=34621 RepID=UPI003F5BF040